MILLEELPSIFALYICNNIDNVIVYFTFQFSIFHIHSSRLRYSGCKYFRLLFVQIYHACKINFFFYRIQVFGVF